MGNTRGQRGLNGEKNPSQILTDMAFEWPRVARLWMSTNNKVSCWIEGPTISVEMLAVSLDEVVAPGDAEAFLHTRCTMSQLTFGFRIGAELQRGFGFPMSCSTPVLCASVDSAELHQTDMKNGRSAVTPAASPKLWESSPPMAHQDPDAPYSIVGLGRSLCTLV